MADAERFVQRSLDDTQASCTQRLQTFVTSTGAKFGAAHHRLHMLREGLSALEARQARDNADFAVRFQQTETLAATLFIQL